MHSCREHYVLMLIQFLEFHTKEHNAIMHFSPHFFIYFLSLAILRELWSKSPIYTLIWVWIKFSYASKAYILIGENSQPQIYIDSNSADFTVI